MNHFKVYQCRKKIRAIGLIFFLFFKLPYKTFFPHESDRFIKRGFVLFHEICDHNRGASRHSSKAVSKSEKKDIENVTKIMYHLILSLSNISLKLCLVS